MNRICAPLTSVVAGAVALVLLAASAVSVAWAAGPFAPLDGTWSGAGQVHLQNGKSESIRCKVYYSPRGGAGLGLALRCASASNKVDLRAALTISGNRVHGTWEERSFNASGTASGAANGNNIKLSITGSGLTGSMTVTTNGRNQSIALNTDAGVRGVNINLRRD